MTMSSFLSGAFSQIAITWALSVLVVWLLARLLLRHYHTEDSFPPGPRPWPIIGNLNLIGRLPHKSLHRLSETYGPLMQLKFGSSNVVVANSPDIAKEFLKTHDRYFAFRPQLAAGKYAAYNFSGVVWGNGPHWRQGRKIFLTNLFTLKRLESYEYIRVEEIQSFLKRLHVLRGKQVHVRDHLSHLNISIMSRVVLGKKFFSESDSQNEKLENLSEVMLDELLEMFDEIFILSGALVIGDWIPWLARFDFQGYVKRMKNLNKKIDKMLEFIMEERRNARNGQQEEEVKDMLAILMDLAVDPSTDVKLTDDNVKAFALDLLAGGTDTSAVSVEWAMAELMKNPEKMKMAKDELDIIVGQERWVEENDIPNLPYLDAVMKESMRLHPTGTLLPPHMAIEDCHINHYLIRKGTLILINIWSMGRNPTLWDSPDEFRPERFLNSDIDIKGQHFELLPFGSGRRMCPGYSLGVKMIKSSLANMIHGFNWSLPQEMKTRDLDMEDVYGLTTNRKHPLIAIPEPRLSPHLYIGPCPP